jgi:hypothetical protein
VALLISLCPYYITSGSPERRTTDSKKASKSNIEESPEPIGKPDPNEPVTVSGAADGSKGEAKGIAM